MLVETANLLVVWRVVVVVGPVLLVEMECQGQPEMEVQVLPLPYQVLQ
jgi:hypothetical protein